MNQYKFILFLSYFYEGAKRGAKKGAKRGAKKGAKRGGAPFVYTQLEVKIRVKFLMF